MTDDSFKKPALMNFLVFGIVRRFNGQTMIVRRPKKELGKSDAVPEWTFPGGRPLVTESRQSFIEREILRETGYEVRPIRQITVRRHPQISLEASFYLCQPVSEEPTAEPSNPGEVVEIKWVKPAEIKNYLIAELVPEVIQELGVS